MKRTRLLLLAWALVLGLSACGKAPSGTTTTAASEPASTEAPAPAVKHLRMPDGECQTFNPYLANTQDEMMNDFAQARLYRRFAKEDRKTLYMRPELAAEEPIQMDAEGKVWQIKIRPNLFFTDYQGNLTDRPINAAVFEHSFKMALDPVLKQRAGDNMSIYITIVNAKEYFQQTPEAPVKWEDVGIKTVDDLTLELTLAAPSTQMNVMQAFTGYGTVPTDPDLFTSLMENGATAYGTDHTKTLYCGAFYVTDWVKSSAITLKKNPHYVFADEIKLTDATLYYVENYQTQLEMYLKGDLDSTALDAEIAPRYAEREDYLSYPARYLMQIEINRGNTEKPILDNMNFKNALWYAVDRVALAKLEAATPANYIIPDTSLADSETGLLFKDTDTAKSYREDINASYDPAKAKEYFDKAMEEEQISGKLTLELIISPATPEQSLCAQFLQQHLAEIFGEDRFELKITENQDRANLMKTWRDNPNAYELCLSNWSRAVTDDSPFNVFDKYSEVYDMKVNAPYGNAFINETIFLQTVDPQVKTDQAYNVFLAGQMEKEALENRLVIPMFERNFQYLISPKLVLPLEVPQPSMGFTLRPWLADLLP
nr:hypothetical protein [Lachnospiraceae bacterium]